MSIANTKPGGAAARTIIVCIISWSVMCMAGLAPRASWGQEAADSVAADSVAADRTDRVQMSADEAVKKAEEDLAGKEESQQSETPAALATQQMEKINLLVLMFKGGPLMWPIGAMSLLVVTFGVERLLALRRRKVLPLELIVALGRLVGQPGGLEPRKAYKLCQQYPSSAANVIRAMLLKIGRPHAELEHAVTEAEGREASRLYANVRWLGLAAGVTPLLGLLGTVWGMIHAFFATANLPTGANKAEVLAEGIYMALVTTFAGLAVAIPAAVLAHMLEGRIQKLFRELDETLLGLMPQLERFEGRLRVSREGLDPPEMAPDAAGSTAAAGSAAAGSRARRPAGEKPRSQADPTPK